ncbi:MAG TPA: helix-turn-helix transcriptional regulator [Mycobacteriales bacterium]|nr:helix-turn-helix transcriptional regulator [Mycobacteriales bacterium]
MDGSGSALVRRQVGARLRHLREAAGVSMEQVAGFLDCSVAKVSRIETGKLLARVPDVRHMLDLYGITDPERDELLALVGQSRQKGWWHDHSPAIGSDTRAMFLGLHDAAVGIVEYAPHLLPELVHTPDYTRAALPAGGSLGVDHVEQVVRLRAAHQDAVLDRPDPPRIVWFIDEAVACRPVGSPAVWRTQLGRLIELARREHVTVRLVPLTAGPGPAGGVAFVRLDFLNPADPPVVFLDRLHDSHIETRRATVDHYTGLVGALTRAALSPAQTIDRLTGCAHRIGRPTSGPRSVAPRPLPAPN